MFTHTLQGHKFCRQPGCVDGINSEIARPRNADDMTEKVGSWRIQAKEKKQKRVWWKGFHAFYDSASLLPLWKFHLFRLLANKGKLTETPNTNGDVAWVVPRAVLILISSSHVDQPCMAHYRTRHSPKALSTQCLQLREMLCSDIAIRVFFSVTVHMNVIKPFIKPNQSWAKSLMV